MIQRIQTLHLLIVTALMAVTLFAPLAWFAGDAGEFRLYAFSLQTSAGEAVQSTVYKGVVLALATAARRFGRLELPRGRALLLLALAVNVLTALYAAGSATV